MASIEITPDGFSVPSGDQTTLTATVRNRRGQTLDRLASWQSSDTSVATMSGGTLRAIRAGTALVIAEVDGVSDTAVATVTVVPTAVDSVIVDPASANLVVGQHLALTAQPVDTTGTAIANRSVTWSSADAAIATVSSAGVLTGVAAGQTTLTALADGQTTTADVTVSPAPPVPVAAVAVSPSPASLTEGSTLQLTGVTTDAGGATLTGRTITWGTSNDRIAKVSTTGLVTGVGAGTATVTATSEGQSGATMVQVGAAVIQVASVALNQASATIAAGASVQLVATPKDASGNALSGRTISWTSSSSSIATVSASGLVTGASAGTATITAAVEGVHTSATVTVTAPAQPQVEDPAVRVGYYVSPTGASSASGSISSPWDLASVLRGSQPIGPGDTVWVLSGTYRGDLVSYLNGNASQQVVVRQAPSAHATIDGSLLVLGSYTTFWGLEVMNSSPTSDYRIGVNVKSPGSRMVNLVVHDAGASGVGLWNEAPGAVLYGSIVYNNGTNTNQDHGVYFNGNTGSKYVQDNVVFDNWTYGLHGYSAIQGELQNLHVDGNTVFNNGSVGPNGRGPDLFVGGSTINSVWVTNNTSWRPDDAELTLRLGSGSGLTLSGNTMVGNTSIGAFSGLSQSSNTFWSSAAPPTSGTSVVVRPNAFEAGRANIIVYNWSGLGSVSADVSRVLRVGDTYEVRDVQNFYGSPVLRGTYGGGTLSLPMTAVAPPSPIGRAFTTPESTGTKFHVFVVVKTN